MTGVFASMANIVADLRENKSRVDAKNVLAHFKRRQQQAGSAESKLGAVVSGEELLQHAPILVGINDYDPIWLRRTTQKVLTPFHETLSENELGDASVTAKGSETASALCEALKRAEEDYKGLPTDEFKQLNQLFGC